MNKAEASQNYPGLFSRGTEDRLRGHFPPKNNENFWELQTQNNIGKVLLVNGHDLVVVEVSPTGNVNVAAQVRKYHSRDSGGDVYAPTSLTFTSSYERPII